MKNKTKKIIRELISAVQAGGQMTGFSTWGSETIKEAQKLISK